MKHNKPSDETKRIFRKAELGVPGVYTGFSYKTRKLLLPALIVAAFLSLSFFCVSNVLYSSGALKVNRVTLYCSRFAYTTITHEKTHYSVARSADVISDTKSFCQNVSVHKCSDAQLAAIMTKYGIHTDDSIPNYILVSEDNEVIEYTRHLKELFQAMADYGYLEVEDE